MDRRAAGCTIFFCYFLSVTQLTDKLRVINGQKITQAGRTLITALASFDSLRVSTEKTASFIRSPPSREKPPNEAIIAVGALSLARTTNTDLFSHARGSSAISKNSGAFLPAGALGFDVLRSSRVAEVTLGTARLWIAVRRCSA
jgi:hypothetical protein